jgi:predicted outer membrane repeat protein
MMKKRSLLALVLGFGLAAATLILIEGTPSARAAGPWYVSSTGNNTTCDSWPTACTTIDGAHTKASSGDTINVAAGTYVENLYIGKDITLLGAGAGSTIVDGGNTGSTIRVYQYTSVTISGMTIRNGSGTLGAGGGIRAERDTTVQVSNATIYNNRATTDGGGMYLALNSVVTVTNSTIISNTAGTDGGGIYGDDPNGTLTIIDSTISENAAGRDGGGVYQNAGTLTIEGSDIISNTAQDNGGGIRKSYGSMSIGTTLIANNTAVDWGGGIHGTDSTVTIDDSTIRDNQVTAAGSYGGGLFSSADMTLTNVTVSGNTSLSDGGGIHSQHPMTLTNVTVSGNTSPNGGGIVHTSASYTMTLRNSSVVSNTTGGGGGPAGMRLYSWVVMENTIIANNEITNCGIGSGGSLTSLGYNLESADTCGLNATGDITDTNPLIGPLQDNGGTTVGIGEATLTHALLPKSPAINAGDPAFSPPPDTDQRGTGFPRVLYGRVDIGAYEVTLILDQYIYLPLVLRDN